MEGVKDVKEVESIDIADRLDHDLAFCGGIAALLSNQDSGEIPQDSIAAVLLSLWDTIPG